MRQEPTHALWIDLETTNVDELTGEVLEVACVLTPLTALAPELSRYQLVIRPARDGWEELMPPVVREMHEENGLLAEIVEHRDPLPRHQVDVLLVAWRRAAVREARAAGHVVETPLVLAGSGVGHFDGRWLRQHFPEFSRALTYYPHDVGVLRRQLRWAGAPVPPYPFPGEKAHRALDDVLDHIAEWRWYATHLSNLGLM